MTGLYVVTGGPGWRRVAEAAAGEADFLQLRDKRVVDRELYVKALQVRRAVDGTDTSFVVNDRVDVALAAGADGVHLGKTDLPLEVAKELLSDGVVGASVDDVEEAVDAAEVADYVSIGPVFATDSKPDAGEPVGTGTVRAVKEAVEVPVVAIGGIDASNAAEVAEAGADYVAVMSAVAENPEDSTRELVDLLEER